MVHPRYWPGEPPARWSALHLFHVLFNQPFLSPSALSVSRSRYMQVMCVSFRWRLGFTM
ncbi:hypothetical protein HanRHA438_Chr13g0583511 [Helianthus annuus]|nr:hypothetical protein HanIR_Chr13g0623311 [Helianthus annuus]KAJ0545447.1 hypothetical protein HanIR_Chr08g0349961 [Helianthus annuus]KAJ0856871.1 hypothetical protein HanRHA438_Chr13g0583511 [Helianthus annuus]